MCNRNVRHLSSRPTSGPCPPLPCAFPHPPQEASKARESRLRKAGLQGRARMASELREMDNDIAALSKALAVSDNAATQGPLQWPVRSRLDQRQRCLHVPLEFTSAPRCSAAPTHDAASPRVCLVSFVCRCARCS